MQAIINVPICPVQSAPEATNLVDEVLFGMVVEITGPARDGWVPMRTHYRYEGYVPESALVTDPALVEQWQASSRRIVRHRHFADVLAEPRVQGAFVAKGLPLGARLAVTGPADENGWQPVRLPDGRTGFTCASFLDTLWETPCAQGPALRRALTDAARFFAGTQYRWGGKTPQGVDCSGLCSMSYMLCGINIYRDASIEPGFPIHRIHLSEMREGDLLYFPGHIAMYLGDGEYIHSTGHKGDNGVTINSLYPESPIYRKDLPNEIVAIGSYFGEEWNPEQEKAE
ncbi:MAG: C40 family peptidase [Oscillospiraceae bacterium]|nr:C40 family peptidase [Oscillospiraceae bacterium]